MTAPMTPYAGTSGWSGTDTSRDRATSRDASGKTRKVQEMVYREVIRSGPDGVTIAELRDLFTEHHGSLSGALTVLHMKGKVARLVQRRGRCKVYVHPCVVNDRPVERYVPRRPPVVCPSCGHDLQEVTS